MAHQDKSLFNTRDYCRGQILTYLDYYKKENHKEIGASFIISIAQYVGTAVDHNHGAHYFCDEIDVEILFDKYIEYKDLDMGKYSDEYINMLKGYMARKLQARVNGFYRLLKKNEYSVKNDNISSSKDKKKFLKRCNILLEENPKIIRYTKK